MSRYIDAEPLDKEISSWITDARDGNLDKDELIFNETLIDCMEAISKQPTADVTPVIHAKLLNPNPYGSCSNCNNLIDIRDGFNYCPKCGARLDAVTE